MPPNNEIQSVISATNVNCLTATEKQMRMFVAIVFAYWQFKWCGTSSIRHNANIKLIVSATNHLRLRKR